MDIAPVNGVELEYEVNGTGEPVLLISPVLPNAFAPIVSEPSLADHYQLIRYHKRGWVGSTHTPAPVRIEDHADDAAALLDHLGVGPAHVVGHSSGAAVAAQVALDHPEAVATLSLLELTMFSLPEGGALLAAAAPVLDTYASGDHETAFAMFMNAVTGSEWSELSALLDRNIPGEIAQVLKDIDTLFGVELPAVAQWQFGVDQAAAIHVPVLSVLGSDTGPVWVEISAFLRQSIPNVEERVVDGVGHLLQVQDPAPVARELAAFLRRHPTTSV